MFNDIAIFQPEDDGKVFMCNYSSPAYTQDEYMANDTMKSLEITVQGIPLKYSSKFSFLEMATYILSTVDSSVILYFQPNHLKRMLGILDLMEEKWDQN